MAEPDYSMLFKCPKCSSFGSIYLVKLAGTQMIIKQKCPTHGGRVIKIPIMRKDVVSHLLHDGVFRCIKCGQQAPVHNLRVSGPWTLIRLNCPTHGIKVSELKIWSIIYSEITIKHGAEPQFAPPQKIEVEPVESAPLEKPPTTNGEKKFCPNCGVKLDGIETFCGACGAEIE
ncbi:MAG: zinc ribbon domain-containing protein [Promethearchaeota archaeon]|nr:MAG: zinc ribbon domain-containing protein [Candidatus Lokiarchaeota archaeon]